MHILLTGASGFIGRHLLAALLQAGHHVRCARRSPPASPQEGVSTVLIDFNQAVQPSDWAEAVTGVDVVVNAVGILREAPGQSFDTLHRAAPCALFQAAAQAGVTHVIQVSALGSDAQARSPYHLSKKAADDFLLALPIRTSVVQPSLVYGPGGASAAMFDRFASLPLIPLPGRGEQTIQPIHIDDLVQGLIHLIESRPRPSQRIALVGPSPTTLRCFYADLRSAMAIRRPARFLPIPMAFMRFAARLGRWLPGGFLDNDTLQMLERGNTAPADDTCSLLGHESRPVRQFIPAAYADAVSTQARMRWLLPIMRISVALVWIVTGLVSLGLYPTEDSYDLLARVGTPAALAPLLLYGAAALDILLGVLTLLPRRHRALWLAQACLVLGYTVIITLKIPEFWLHPYGPILKNLPFLAALWVLYELENRAWSTSS